MEKPTIIPFFLLLIALLHVQTQEYPRRMLAKSPLFDQYTVFSKRWSGKSALDDIVIPTNMGQHHNKTHSVQLIQGYFGLYHTSNVTGYEMISYLVEITNSSMKLQVNSFFFCGAEGYCLPNYYHYRFIIFLMTKQSPLSRLMVPTFFDPVGHPGNKDLIEVQMPLVIPIQRKIKEYCYLDRTNTTRDRLHIWQINNALFFEGGLMEAESTPPNRKWVFDLADNDTNITYNLTIRGYYIDASFITSIILAYCPNAYFFTDREIYIHFGQTLEMQPNYEGTVVEIRNAQPIDDDYPPALAFSLIKLDAYNIKAESVSLFYNVTAFYNLSSGERVPNSMRFWYTSNMPHTAIVNYLMMGRLTNCYNNYQRLNTTHCFCNSSKYLFYNASLSYSSCVLLCPSNMYQNEQLQICIPCNATYGLGCAECSISSCLKCSEPLFLFVNGSLSVCYNCIQLHGQYCYDCNDQHCTTCNYNYLLINQTCQCRGDRHISNTNYDQSGNVIFQECLLCNQTIPGCTSCTINNCSSCANNFTLSAGSSKTCLCLQNFSLVNNSCLCLNNTFAYKDLLCKSCKVVYQGCLTCDVSRCLSCQIDYVLRLGQCECSGDRFLANSSCTLCSAEYIGCLVCAELGCTICDNNYLLSSKLCNCAGSDRYLSANLCKLCSQMAGCLSCTANNQCNTCLSGYALATNNTIRTCSCLSNTFVNGSCVTCSFTFGLGCSTCSNTCLSCISNYKMNATTLANDFNNPCKPCFFFFDNCETCSNASCLSCQPTYIMINLACVCPAAAIVFNNTCVNCSYMHNYCLNCNPSACLSCFNNFILQSGVCSCSNDRYLQSVDTCVLCNSTYANCQSCSSSKCLTCYSNFLMNNSQCLCSSADRYFLNGNCLLCNAIIGCVSCTSSISCTLCASNFTTNNNTCLCANGYSLINNTKCILCSQIFGVGCIQCSSASNCSVCSEGYGLNGQGKCLACSIMDVLCWKCNMVRFECQICRNSHFLSADRSNCNCPPPSYFIANTNCTPCHLKYHNCLECTNTSCSLCLNNLISISGTCACNNTSYEQANRCYGCSDRFDLCLQCSISTCIECSYNFTLQNGSCLCLPPKVYNPLDKTCLSCISTSCILQIYSQSIQIGSSLYFQFSFSQPTTSIHYKTPLSYNLKALINNQNIIFSQYNQLFTIRLSALSEMPSDNKVLLSIPNKNYVRWQDVTLRNDPLPIRYRIYQDQMPISEEMLVSWFDKVNGYSFILMALSFTSFNRFFQETNMLQLLVFNNYPMDHNLGSLLDISAKKRNYKIIPNRIITTNVDLNEESRVQNIKYGIYGLNEAIITISEQIVLTLITSIALFVYVRGYLLSKSYQGELAFRNIVQFGPEYMMQNVSCSLGYLLLPLCVHLRMFILNQNKYLLNDYIDAIVTITLIALPFFLLAFKLRRYPPGEKRYSVAYGPLKSQKRLALALYLLHFMRPYLIGILVVLFPQQAEICNWIIVGINVANVVMIVGNAYNFSIKISFVVKLVKCLLGLLINLGLHFEFNSFISIDHASFYAFLLINLIEVLESFIGVVAIILRNKNIIADLEPINIETQINEVSREKGKEGEGQQKAGRQKDGVRQGKKELLNSLIIAREQLSAMLQQKRRRNKK